MRCLFSLLLVGFSVLPSPASSQPASGDKTAEALLDNVVQVHAVFGPGHEEWGFGIIVSESDQRVLIATANHLVRYTKTPEVSPPTIEVRFHCELGAPWQEAERLPEHEGTHFDIAVLRTKASGCMWAKSALAPTAVGLNGTEAWFIGRGSEFFIPPAAGEISSKEPNEFAQLLVERLDALPSSSGGPLITKDGIVGLITAGGGNGGQTEVTSISRVQWFFTNKWGYSWQLEIWSTTPSAAELSSLRKWPIVIREPLSAGLPERVHFALGQYGAAKSFAVSPDGGLRVGGAHSDSVAWWDLPLAAPYLISTELKIERTDILRPALWILGPGYGVSPDSAYVLTFEDAQRATLAAEGLAVSPSPAFLGQALAINHWYKVDLLVERHRVKLFLSGAAVAEWPVSSLPNGALHSFFGLGARNGVTYEPSAAVFRNLEVRRPSAGEDVALPVRMLDPARSGPESFMACQRPLRDLNFESNVPQTGWTAIRDPGAVEPTEAGLLLRAGNETPSVWLDPISAGEEFAAEFLIQLPPNADSVNVRFLIAAGAVKKKEADVFDGWVLAFPMGAGRIELRQVSATQVGDNFWASYEASRLVRQSAYYSPVNGRDYRVRFERYQKKFRVLTNGGVLFEVADPWAEKGTGQVPVQLAVTKVYGGLLIKRIDVWTGCPAGTTAEVGGPAVF